MKKITVEELAKFVLDTKKLILDISYQACAGHIGSALSINELVAVLYANFLDINVQNADNPTRDRFILSKGHAVAALYAALYKKGIISREKLFSYGKDGGLCEHPEIEDMGVDMSTGSLGHGLAFGLGIALGNKKLQNLARTWVLISDGECGEGTIWEAALLAPRLSLDNLTVIVDYNKWQCLGKIEEITPLEPFVEKWKSFGWNALEIYGHDITQITKAYDTSIHYKHKPTVIIAHTVSGKGVKILEDQLIGHYKVLNTQEYNLAKKEIT